MAVTLTTTPRIAAQYLLGGGHDLLHGNGATYSVVAVVNGYRHSAEDLADGTASADETTAVVVRLRTGRLPVEALGIAAGLVRSLGGDGVFFFRPDQVVAGGSAY